MATHSAVVCFKPGRSQWTAFYAKLPPPEKLQCLASLSSLVANHIWIAADLDDNKPARSQKQEYFWELRRSLHYYYDIALAIWYQAELSFRSQEIDHHRQLLRVHLDELAIQLVMLDVDISTPFESFTVEGGQDLCTMANRQAMELLVLVVLQKLPASANLATLQEEMLKTRIVKYQRAGANNDTGLPVVCFVCIHHRIVACSGDRWPPMLDLAKQSSLSSRLARFNDAARKQSLITKGKAVQNRFSFMNGRLKAFNDNTRTFLALAQDCSQSLENYRDFMRAMVYGGWTNLSVDRTRAGGTPLGASFAFDHRSESARSFRSNGENMFDEMSRCWKCRFEFDYNIPQENPMFGIIFEHPDGLGAEDPWTTAWNANAPLNCAEDLCHFLCDTAEASQLW